MAFVAYIFLLVIFVLFGGYVVHYSRRGVKNILLVGGVSAIILATLILFSYHYREMDALGVILLLITAIACCIFFTVNALR